jgi:hypothetical protein
VRREAFGERRPQRRGSGPPGATTTCPARRPSPRRPAWVVTAASRTSGIRSSCASTSAGSTRCPSTLSWASRRPRYSRQPSGPQTTQVSGPVGPERWILVVGRERGAGELRSPPVAKGEVAAAHDDLARAAARERQPVLADHGDVDARDGVPHGQRAVVHRRRGREAELAAKARLSGAQPVRQDAAGAEVPAGSSTSSEEARSPSSRTTRTSGKAPPSTATRLRKIEGTEW